MSWWNSAETIQWWSICFNVLMAFCGLLTGLLGIGALVFGLRASSLAEEKDRAKEHELQEALDERDAAIKAVEVTASESLKYTTAKSMIDVLHQHLKSPRQMTDKQVNSLRTVLRDIGTKSILIAAVQNEEPVAFAKQLTSVFKGEGWTITGHNTVPPNIDGITLLGHCDRSVPSWGPKLFQSLRVDMNFKCSVGYALSIPKHSVGLFISENPLAKLPKPDPMLRTTVNDDGDLQVSFRSPDETEKKS